MTYLVIGLCIFLLILVIYISAKPISMGIEARRNLKDNLENFEENNQNTSNFNEDENTNNVKISDEITKLNDLKNKGILTEQEYKKAKSKLLD
tara:strand:+ start:403 stop:681 length:279 start_codon:yes stop_codon:yes gene_type:complete